MAKRILAHPEPIFQELIRRISDKSDPPGVCLL